MPEQSSSGWCIPQTRPTFRNRRVPITLLFCHHAAVYAPMLRIAAVACQFSIYQPEAGELTKSFHRFNSPLKVEAAKGQGGPWGR